MWIDEIVQEYLEKFGDDEALEVMLNMQGSDEDRDGLLRDAIDRGKPATLDEVVARYFAGDTERLKKYWEIFGERS